MADNAFNERVEQFKAILPNPPHNLALISLLKEPAGEGCCTSCGSKLTRHEHVRCKLCADALWYALFNESRPKGEMHRPSFSMNDLEAYDD